LELKNNKEEASMTAKLYQWNVYIKDIVGGKPIETFVECVEAATSSDACAWVCQTRWLSRLKLVAYAA